MKNLTSKKAVLLLGILLLATVAIVFFVLFQDEKKPVSQPPSTESSLLSNCVSASLIQTDSELNINLDKSSIFGGIYVFLKPFSDQKETRILELEARKIGEILNLEELCSELDVNISDSVARKIGKHYTLAGFFSQLENKEWELKSLGLVMEMKSEEKEAVRKSLREWERTMAGDVIPLALIKNKESLPMEESEENKFHDGDYKNIAIRYSKLPSGRRGEAINYIFADDKIFITTSKESIYAIIDLLE